MPVLSVLFIVMSLGLVAPAQDSQTRVFLLDAKQLAGARQRVRAGDPALKPALARLDAAARSSGRVASSSASG